jgi:hypothetical protein
MAVAVVCSRKARSHTEAEPRPARVAVDDPAGELGVEILVARHLPIKRRLGRTSPACVVDRLAPDVSTAHAFLELTPPTSVSRHPSSLTTLLGRRRLADPRRRSRKRRSSRPTPHRRCSAPRRRPRRAASSPPEISSALSASAASLRPVSPFAPSPPPLSFSLLPLLRYRPQPMLTVLLPHRPEDVRIVVELRRRSGGLTVRR